MWRNPFVPKTFGWRSWVWVPKEGRLYSPYFLMRWEESAARAENWDQYPHVFTLEESSPDGWFGPGINAAFVPFFWKKLSSEHIERAGAFSTRRQNLPLYIVVSGIVERYGKYVQGTKGWRSEWAIIKELYVPYEAIAAELRKAYPDVEVTTK